MGYVARFAGRMRGIVGLRRSLAGAGQAALDTGYPTLPHPPDGGVFLTSGTRSCFDAIGAISARGMPQSQSIGTSADPTHPPNHNFGLGMSGGGSRQRFGTVIVDA